MVDIMTIRTEVIISTMGIQLMTTMTLMETEKMIVRMTSMAK